MRTRQQQVTLMMAGGAMVLIASISTTLSAGQPGGPAQTQVAAPAPSSQVPVPPAQPATTAAPALTPGGQLVATYCVSCHNDRLKAGSFSLQHIDSQNVFNSAEAWEKVVLKLRARAMPPPNVRRPDGATYDRVATWLEGELDRAAAAHVNPGRTAGLHRLNRAEYANAIRDLLGVEIDTKVMLPADEQAHGFDTNGDALSIQPALLERYVAAAAKIARLAVGDPSMPAGAERYTAVKDNSNEFTWLWHDDRLGEEFPLGSRGGIVARHYFPLDAEYNFRVRLDRAGANGVIHGLRSKSDIEIRVDQVRVGQLSIGGTPGAADAAADDPDGGNATNDADANLEVRVPVKAGMRQVTATIIKSDNLEMENLAFDWPPIWSLSYADADPPLVISSLLVGGPYDGRVSQDSPVRKKLYVCQPTSAGSETACATKILSALAQRAYRRALTNKDTETLLTFYRTGRAKGNFDAGIRAAVERVLVSPDFLFRIAKERAGGAPGTVYVLPDVELASRLSFFLWSSIPDDELLDTAIKGKLSDPAVLEKQVRRMLADPRARAALVQNFFDQWLQTRNVWKLQPDLNQKFPWFNDNLRIAFVREMELFLDAQLQEDRSIVDLLSSNETFLNDRLAGHYGVKGVYGSHFRAVTLTDENRFGLLGKAAVLAVTSYSTRTAPTIRGKYLLENILAAPTPPPPPDIPALDESGKDGKAHSVREMLETHRKNPVCASCHARMDPLGLSLENFDALGQWRTTDAGVPIDASGVLLDGTQVDGPAALRRALVAQKEQFVKAVVGKLMMYSIGRGLEYYDEPAIRGIVRTAAADDYRWSSTILALVKSAPFRMRRMGS